MKSMSRGLKLTLLLSASLVCTSVGAAWAQDSESDDDSGKGKLDKIVVTATKRSEDLQDVPISITAFSEADIELLNPEGLKDLADYVPNMWMPASTEAGQSYITLRGIGPGFSRSGGRSVGVYIDGVYVSGDSTMDISMADITSVEVLKGPQGTLFGRDTIGGAINITTKSPGNELGGNLFAEVGNYGLREFKLGVTMPIYDDTLSARFVGLKRDTGGYIENAFTGVNAQSEDHIGFTGQLYYTPNSTTDARLSYTYTKRDDHPNTMGEASARRTNSDSIPYTINLDHDEQWQQDSHRLSLAVNKEFGKGWVFSSISGFTKSDDFYTQDFDRSPLSIFVGDYNTLNDSFSQEFRLASPDFKRGNFVAGAYYLDVYEDYQYTYPVLGAAFFEGVFIPPGTYPFIAGPDILDGQTILKDDRTVAAYINGNFHVNDRLSLVGGLRYTSDKKDIDYSIYGEGLTLFGLPSFQYNVPTITDNPVTWTIGARFAASDNINTYATISKGYRTPAVKDSFVNINDVLANVSFATEPEFVTNYEVGVKSTLLDDRVRANLSVFYMDYTDRQVSLPNQTFPFLRDLTNSGKATIKGFEADLVAQVTENLRLSGAVGYLRTEFGEGTPIPALIGFSFATSPEWTISGAIDYDIPLNNDYEWSVHLDYADRTLPSNLNPVLQTGIVGAYGVFNASTAVVFPNDRVRATLWVRNLTDVNDPAVSTVWGGGLPHIENDTTTYEAPRTFGVSVDYQFGP